jgi:DNA transposition AAA+ family ATPase
MAQNSTLEINSETLRNADRERASQSDTQLAIREKLGIKPADDDGDLPLPGEFNESNSNGPTELQQRHRDAKKYNIGTDVVVGWTESLPEDQRTAVRWLHTYACQNDYSFAELANFLRRKNGAPYDGHTIYRILRGKRDNAGVDQFVRAIADFRARLEETEALHRGSFVPTRLTRRLFKIFEAARLYRKIIFVYSDGQVGKSTGAAEFHRLNAGQTILFRLPAGANKRAVLRLMCQQLNLPDDTSNIVMQERITRCFSKTMTLIFDEFHQVFTGRFQVETLEIIREIFDRCGCGMVFIGTKIIEDQLQRGKHKTLLKQISRRAIAKICLPAIPARAELDAFAADYGLPPATGDALKLQTTVINDQDHGGLGVWCTYLQAGCHVAGKKKQKMTWQHVQDAYKGLKTLEQMTDLD